MTIGDTSRNANEQEWWINATERPEWFADLEKLLVQEGLCDWEGRGDQPHPQKAALITIWALRKLGVLPPLAGAAK